MKIKFSKHIREDKLPLLNKHGFNISAKQLIQIIESPDHVDKISDAPNCIVSKRLDERHVLRVVYKIEDDIIKAITCYPAEVGRYY